MQPSGLAISVPLIGILVQLGACVLVTVLMLGLRREARGHDYFRSWSRAWVAMSAAIALIAFRYLVVPFVASDSGGAPAGQLQPIYAGYQIAKFLFFGYLLLGVLALSRNRASSRKERMAVVAGAAGLGLVTTLPTRDLNVVVMVQAIVAVPVFTLAAWRVARMPGEHDGPGIRILLIAMVMLAVQWIVYLQAFAVGPQLDTGWERFFLYFARYNSFIDAGQLLVLGIGMVLTLVEHDHRIGSAAQTAQVAEATAARVRLDEILRAAHEGVVTLAADRTIDLANPAAGTILGIAPGEVRGQAFDRFLRADYRASLWEELSLKIRRSEAHPPVSVRREVVGIRADGVELPMELSLSSFGEGPSRGYVLVLRDLTEVIRSREEHERLQSQMAQTARLEAIGRMVSGVAHELNNPLTAIMAFSQDLADTARTAEDREALAVISQQAERCRVIVGDLLVFARSRREERRRLPPAELVTRVARVFERESARHQVTFDVAVVPDLPPIEVDAAGMEQVLTNLLTNAFQASRPGSQVTLTVVATQTAVAFHVDDGGPGVAAAVLPRLFEPFFTTKPPGEGTGLGLSVSHAIVSQHGGTITVANLSSEGGARFTVEIPFVDRRQAEPKSPAAGGRATGAPGRALIVDDESSIRSAIRRLLERRGWSVEEAADGGEGWSKLDLDGRPAGYDLIVTDLRMPGLSGVELVDRLRSVHPGLADRTIVITGDTASPAVAGFLERLRTPYLQKPFDLQALATVVDQIRSGAGP